MRRFLHSVARWTADASPDALSSRSKVTLQRVKQAVDVMQHKGQTMSGRELLEMLDDVSNDVCQVIDVAEAYTNVHPSEAMMETSQTVMEECDEVIQSVNSNVALYRQLVGAIARDPQLQDPSQEAAVVARLLQKDFERGGIGLDDDKRDKVGAVYSQIGNLAAAFSRNITLAASTPLTIADPTTHVRSVLSDDGARQTALSTVANPFLRREIFVKSSMVTANESILPRLLRARAELGQLLGFASYADYALSSSMAGSVATARSFCLKTLKILRAKADSEVERIHGLRRQHEPFRKDPVQAWDVPYYLAILKSSASRSMSRPRQMEELLTCEGVLNGAKAIFSRVFGVELVDTASPPSRTSLWNPDVRRLVAVRSSNKEELGEILLDLHPRRHKFPQCGLFTLRSGRALPGTQNERQLPVVLIGASVPRGAMSAAAAENLLHELGHALHSILGQTRFQHVSGTRTVLDFAEVPSTLMERFLWSPAAFCEVFVSNVPKGEAAQTLQSEVEFRESSIGLRLQKEAIFALFDIDCHCLSPEEAKRFDSTAYLKKLYDEYSSIPFPNVGLEMKNVHFHGYASSFYSYLWCRAHTAEIWGMLFDASPLNREGGRLLEQELLSPGGGREASLLLEALYSRAGLAPTVAAAAARHPNPAALLKCPGL